MAEYERLHISGFFVKSDSALSKNRIITYKFSPNPAIPMEQALILGKISHRVPSNILDRLEKIEGVSEANLIYGPYDFYVTIKTETKEKLGDIAFNIRSIDGVIDSLTCYVVSFSDIRPEAKGSGIE